MQPWTFVHVADPQPGSPRSFRYAPAWAENWHVAMRQIMEIQPEILLVGGDLTRDGSIHEFEFVEMKRDLDSLGIPYLVIPGNMDTGNKHAPCRSAREDRDDPALNVTSDQLQVFGRHFGPASWTLVRKNVRFTGFYAALAGSGLPEENDMWRMLEDLVRQPRATHHVVMTHYPLFLDTLDEPTFNLTKPEEYLPWYFSIDREHRLRIAELLKRASVDIVISGHIHCYKTDIVDGIRYIKAPATCMSQMTDRWPDGDGTLGFLRFEVTDYAIREELVPLRAVSSKKGYGPGGHPKPEQRDYSLAWEKSADPSAASDNPNSGNR